MKLLLLAALSINLFAADVSTTAQDREPALKLQMAIQAKNSEMSQATIKIQQAELQYTQVMDQNKQEITKLQADYAAALAPLRSKCEVAKQPFDEKALDCVAKPELKPEAKK